MFVPLDLLFKLLIWIGYREMLGPLDPAAAHRLTALAIALSIPFLIGWIAGLVVVLAPIDRWLATHAAPDRGTAQSSAARAFSISGRSAGAA